MSFWNSVKYEWWAFWHSPLSGFIQLVVGLGLVAIIAIGLVVYLLFFKGPPL